jgi:4,5-DOPA dioxygenase extradiol
MLRQPTLFISHGSPLHALDAGEAGRAWQAIAASLPRPRAVLMVSAHWETSLPMLTGGTVLQTIHDFGGFPAPLYKLRYDAPGSPQLADEAADLLRARGLGAAALDVPGGRRARGAALRAARTWHAASPADGRGLARTD